MVFTENTRVKIPAILHLCRLGYKYVSLSKAKWNIDTNIFTDIFEETILRINPEMEQGDIKRLLDDVWHIQDLETLLSNLLKATNTVKPDYQVWNFLDTSAFDPTTVWLR